MISGVMRTKPKRSRKQNSDWSSDETMRLILLIEAHPLLWDDFIIDYKNRAKRSSTLYMIAKQMGKDENDVWNKWQNLRTTYRGKQRWAEKNNIDTTIDVPRWEFYKPMSFLNKIKYEVKTKSPEPDEVEYTGNYSDNGSSYRECVEHVSVSYEECDDDEEIKPIPPPTPPPPLPIMQNLTPEPESLPITAAVTPEPKRKLSRRYETVDYHRDLILNRAIDLMAKPQDGCQIFGDFVAQQMRKLSETKRNRLELIIQKALVAIHSEPNEHVPRNTNYQPQMINHNSQVPIESIKVEDDLHL